MTWALFFASSGALLTLMGATSFPPWLAATTAALSVLSLVAQNQKRSTDCSDLHARWQTLANDYQSLWDDMYTSDAPSKLDALRKREVEIGKTSNTFSNRKKRMAYWQHHVQRHHVAA